MSLISMREPPVGLLDVAGRLLQRAEMPAERELLASSRVLVVEHQHGETVHAGLDRRGRLPADRPAQIDAADLAGEIGPVRVHRPDG